MIVLSERDVAALLPMDVAVDVVEQAMIAVSQGKAVLPLRTIMGVGGSNMMGMMPGSMSEPPCYGIKLVSLFPGNPEAGYSSHQGAIVLFEAAHGSAVAMMNAGLLTAVRTAAASAVATRHLARPDSSILTIIGTGEQAEHHIDAMLAVRPIREIRIVGRRAGKARQFAEHAAVRRPEISFSHGTDVASAVSGADIVCTVTSSPTPVLAGALLEPGMHLNIVGASIPSKVEIDEEAVLRSAVFVDYRPSTFAQAGEVVEAIKAGSIRENNVLAEIGEVAAGTHVGRMDDGQITLYRSLGIAAQDLACASHVVDLARQRGLGVDAPLD